jgi:PAS domain S-box-containing protein
VIVVDAAGNITLLNPIAEKLTGWKLREAEGLPLRDVFQIVHETTREPMEDPTVRVLREGITQAIANATALIGKNGGERLIEDCASPIRSRDSRVRGAILVFRDVTESRRAENALRESEERFRRMADTAPVMIWTSGRDKRSDWFNRPWLDFVGKPLDEEVGEGWKRNVHPDDLDKHNETYVTSFGCAGVLPGGVPAATRRQPVPSDPRSRSAPLLERWRVPRLHWLVHRYRRPRAGGGRAGSPGRHRGKLE